MRPPSREAFPPLCDLLDKAVDGGRSSMEFHILRMAFRRAVVVEDDPAAVPRGNTVTHEGVTRDSHATHTRMVRQIEGLNRRVRELEAALSAAKEGQGAKNQKGSHRT